MLLYQQAKLLIELWHSHHLNIQQRSLSINFRCLLCYRYLQVIQIEKLYLFLLQFCCFITHLNNNNEIIFKRTVPSEIVGTFSGMASFLVEGRYLFVTFWFRLF
ncbi:unnamed protein product [Paramecium octaurelia]|uniref:Uncharacterized protein n=1 Tax=Paramecium octaurelia TaxID=43137 RepID=A0A8S1TH83_PAROT|nr:unnamed protein product [Paramecium octaurelia]